MNISKELDELVEAATNLIKRILRLFYAENGEDDTD